MRRASPLAGANARQPLGRRFPRIASAVSALHAEKLVLDVELRIRGGRGAMVKTTRAATEWTRAAFALI